MYAFSEETCESLSVLRVFQMPEPAVISVRLATRGPFALAAACLRLAPVAVMPVETITEVRDLSLGL